MAIYPDEAVVSATAFATLTSGTGTITPNGSSTGPFNLPTSVSFVGQVFVITSGGLTVDVTSYYLTGSGASITFYSAPAAGTYTVRCIDLPGRYRVVRSTPNLAVNTVRYSSANSFVGGNNYATTGARTTFSLPERSLGALTNANQIFVYINGLTQPASAYTYPSAVLSTNGITFGTAPAANANVEIRTFTTQASYTTRFTSMADRKPNNGYMTQQSFNISKYSSQVGYEKRRLMSRRPKRSYQIAYTNVTGVEKQAIENFYRARNGEYETFTFDLTHINDSGTVRCRFNGPLEIQQVISGGASNPTKNIYNIRLNLQEDFD